MKRTKSCSKKLGFHSLPWITPTLTSTLLAVCLFPLLSPTIAHADDDKAPFSGRSAGGRGCGINRLPSQPGIPAVILLVPDKQPGQSVSTRPTFAWFVRDAETVPLEFRIYEQQSKGYTLVKEIKGDRLKSTPGIMVLTPDQLLTELEVGKRYRWQVELVCDANRPAGNPLAESVLEVVPMQPSLQSQLQQTRDRASQAKLFDQANLWYDTLTAVFEPSGDAGRLKPIQTALFDRVALTPTEHKLLQSSKISPAQR